MHNLLILHLKTNVFPIHVVVFNPSAYPQINYILTDELWSQGQTIGMPRRIYSLVLLWF